MLVVQKSVLMKYWYYVVVVKIFYSLPTLDSINLHSNQSSTTNQVSSNTGTTTLPTLRPSLLLAPIPSLPPTVDYIKSSLPLSVIPTLDTYKNQGSSNTTALSPIPSSIPTIVSTASSPIFASSSPPLFYPPTISLLPTVSSTVSSPLTTTTPTVSSAPTVTCLDENNSYAYWESLGYCEKSSVHLAYMLKTCRKSCVICKAPTLSPSLTSPPTISSPPTVSLLPTVTPSSSPTSPPTVSQIPTSSPTVTFLPIEGSTCSLEYLYI